MTMEMFFNLPTMIISALFIYSKHFQLVKAFSERLFPACIDHFLLINSLRRL